MPSNIDGYANGDGVYTDDGGTAWIVEVKPNGKPHVTMIDNPDPIIDYGNRNKDRLGTLEKATINFVGYFMSLGDDQPTAEDKVGQFSDEANGAINRYNLGRVDPLRDAIDNSALSFMDAAAKTYLKGELGL